MLLDHGAEVDPRDDSGQSPLHLVSNRMAPELQSEDESSRSIFARILVERGADVKARDMRNATPLHFASYHGRPEIAQLLFEHGANAQAEDNLGRSPLHEVSRGVYEHQRYPFFTMGTPGVRVLLIGIVTGIPAETRGLSNEPKKSPNG
jgi:ankyrin repeat protein